MRKLSVTTGIPLEEIAFNSDAILPGGDNYPAKVMGMETGCVKSPDSTLADVAGIPAF